MADYTPFLGSPSGEAWRRLGVRRRAGILAPLFSIRSTRSVGVGEIPDLEILADCCRRASMSLIQLLPLNDVGTRFCPYDAESSFALEPMHLSPEDLAGVPKKKFAPEIAFLRARYAGGGTEFDPRVKRDKLALLGRIYSECGRKASPERKAFKEEQAYWLEDHALFKALKTHCKETAWEAWPQPLRDREKAALRSFSASHREETGFEEWLQWQLFRQMSSTAAKVRKKNVHLIGDLPFLVARDSSDVWAHPDYFRLDLSSGAPPDKYFADGQEWGMPPYRWPEMAAHSYDYLKKKLAVADRFYDLYRLDHFVGLFRVWVFPKEGGADRKAGARFEPADEALWVPQAEDILSAMLHNGRMLPCAEDLGTVPDVAREVLKKYAIPGMDVQRWMRDWEGTGDFTPPAAYRTNAIVTLSTHDMTSFTGWWRTEATPEDQERFSRFVGAPPAASLHELLRLALEKAQESASVFAIHSFQDWMAFAGLLGEDGAELRINRPGILDEHNWRLRMPLLLEDWLKHPSIRSIHRLNRAADRV